MLGGWQVGPRFLNNNAGEMKMSEKVEALLRLVEEFSEEEYERVMEIIRLALELSPSLSEPL